MHPRSQYTRSECYTILNLLPRASQQTVKAVFKSLALQHVREKAGSSEEEIRSQHDYSARLREAYEVLAGQRKPAKKKRRRVTTDQTAIDRKKLVLSCNTESSTRRSDDLSPTDTTILTPEAMVLMGYQDLFECLRAEQQRMVALGIRRLEAWRAILHLIRQYSPETDAGLRFLRRKWERETRSLDVATDKLLNFQDFVKYCRDYYLHNGAPATELENAMQGLKELVMSWSHVCGEIQTRFDYLQALDELLELAETDDDHKRRIALERTFSEICEGNMGDWIGFDMLRSRQDAK